MPNQTLTGCFELSEDELKALDMCREILILYKKHLLESSAMDINIGFNVLILYIGIVSVVIVATQSKNIWSFLAILFSLIFVILFLNRTMGKSTKKYQEQQKDFKKMYEIYKQECQFLADNLRSFYVHLCDADKGIFKAYYPLITGKRL